MDNDLSFKTIEVQGRDITNQINFKQGYFIAQAYHLSAILLRKTTLPKTEATQCYTKNL